MLKWIQIVLSILCPLLLISQELSNKGRFSIDSNRGCPPFTVSINEIETFGTDDIRYTYLEGASSTGETTFTYEEDGTYQIIQLINTNDVSDKLDTIEVQVLTSLRPEIEVTKCNNLEVAITSIDTYYDSVRIYFSDSDSSTLLFNESTSFLFNSTNAQTITTKGLFTSANEVCDTYSEEILPIAELAPLTIRDISVKESCKDSYTMYLTINDFQPQVNYRIFLSQSTETIVFDGFLDSTYFIIDSIPFEVDDFCVTIASYDPCIADSNLSDSFCDTPTTLSLSPFESLFSTYNESDIYINLDNVSSGSFLVERRFDGSEFKDRTEVLSSFNDPIGVNTRKYFYKINYQDSCGNTLYTAETHPAFIEAAVLSENKYRISFQPALNSLSSMTNDSYIIGNTSESITSSAFDIQLDAENGVPRQSLSAQSTYTSGEIVRSNTVQLKYEFIVHVPRAFTPNGDGLNDTLEFFGLPTNNNELKIYSKWGQLIYRSMEIDKGWDGMYGGTLAPEGTYLYEIIFENEEGKILRQKGTFALINK